MGSIIKNLDRTDIIYVLLLSVIFLFLYPYIFDEKIDVNGDNASYYILGKSLSSGEGFTNIHIPGKPPSNHQPPGYPFLMSIVMTVFSSDPFALKVLNGVFFFGTLILLYITLLLLNVNRHLSFTVCIFLLLNSHLLRYSTIMMTEISFLFFSILSLTFLHKIRGFKTKNRQDIIYIILLIISLTAAYYIRTVGIALIGGVLFYFLLSKKWKLTVITFSGFLLLALPWFIRSQNLGGSSYLKQLFMVNPLRPELGNMELGDWFVRLGANLERYITKEIPNGIFPFYKINYQADTTFGEWILGILLIGIIVLGYLKTSTNKKFLLGYLGGTFFILFLYPDVWFGVRLFIPLFPFLILLLIEGSFFLIYYPLKNLKISEEYFSKRFPFILLVILLPFYFQKIKELNQRAEGNYPPNFYNYFRVALWAKENTEPDAIIACRKVNLFYLFSNRQVTRYKDDLNTFEVIKDFENRQVDYVVLDNLGYASTGRYLYPAIQDYRERFTIVYQVENPNNYLFRFVPE